MRKMVSVFVVFVLLFASALPTLAAVPNEEVVLPQYVYILQTSAGLDINESTGVASCSASCISKTGYTVTVQCELQQYVAASWTTIKTWTSSGSGSASASGTRAVYSGYTYRVNATFTIRNSAGTVVETGSKTETYVYPSN